jgi:hypothetical protein
MADDAVTLRELMELRFREQQRALELLAEANAREVALLKENVERIAVLHAEAHAREHALTQTALEKAERAMEHRLEGLNEFRGQLRDQAATFASRDLVDSRLATLSIRQDEATERIEARLKLLEHNSANLQGRLWSMGAGVALLMTVLTLALRWVAP